MSSRRCEASTRQDINNRLNHAFISEPIKRRSLWKNGTASYKQAVTCKVMSRTNLRQIILRPGNCPSRGVRVRGVKVRGRFSLCLAVVEVSQRPTISIPT